MLLLTVSLLLFLQAQAQVACPTFELPLKNATTRNPKLPNPFKLYSGTPVTTKADWTCKRAELASLIQHFSLGALPPKPSTVTGTLSPNSSQLLINISENSRAISFSVKLQIPEGPGPFPAIIALGAASIPIPNSTIATIIFNNDQLAEQQGQSSRGKGRFYDLYGSGHEAGSLIAWTWGVSRIIDALESLGPEATKIDTKRLGVTGCSRNGKGALVIGAFEDRIALTIPQEGGPGAEVPWRLYETRCRGRICQPMPSEPIWYYSWFRRDFPAAFGTKMDMLPFDQHELVALVAPRGLFMALNQIDWLEYEAGLVGAVAARMVFGALGVKTNMGLDMPAHGHCQFPEASVGYINAFYDRFLLGKDVETDVFSHLGVSNQFSAYSDWYPPETLG